MTSSSSGPQAHGWSDVRANELPDWIRQAEKESPRPIYALAEPDVVRSMVREFAPTEFKEWIHVRPDSGCVEVDFRGRPQTRLVEEVSRDIVRIALDLAQRIDQRKFQPRKAPYLLVRGTEASDGSISQEFESEVDGLGVMGPGGRVHFFDGGVRGVDVVVRRRERKLDSIWRQPERIARRALDAVAGAPDNLRLQASFGYYEASKYEHQTVMRPAFAFLVGLDAGETTPGWRTILVEPATSARDISAWAGLESWAEVEEEE